MAYLITLYLKPPHNTLEYVKQLPGIQGLVLDDEYGLVLISPTRHLYTIRVSGDVDPEQLMSKDPDIIKGVYGEVKISPFQEEDHEKNQ